MKKLTSLVSLIALTVVAVSCSFMSANYISSSDIQRQSVSSNNVKVFYNKNEVPYKYNEIGRVYLKNYNYWADRDPAGQIKKIKQEAASYGADAVIIVQEIRRESSFSVINNTAGGNAGDVYQYSGIAIVKK